MHRNRNRPIAALLIALLLTGANVRSAESAPDPPCSQDVQSSSGHSDIGEGCDATNGSKSDTSNNTRNSGSGTGSTNSGNGNSTPAKKTKTPQQIYDEKVAAIKKKNAAALDAYKVALAQANDHYKTGECTFTPGGSFSGQDCAPNKPNLISIPKPPKGTPAPPPNTPLMPPEEAAYLAIATKLQINASGVGIGPDPDLSKWNMAVVGHSYWLWATGPTHLGPVSDSASGRTVTLEANLTKVTFDMGDGNTVTCNGPGTPYPGDRDGLYSKSPTCGYTYATTSRHHAGGTYPVRATTYWSVAYTAPDGAGTIPIVLATQRNLKVGELQTVITH
jgi:hypothetical protein